MEAAVIDRLLHGVPLGRGGALLVEGEPGIGKSALLDDRVARCRDVRTVQVVGVEAEAALPFGALSELLAQLPVPGTGLPAPLRGLVAPEPLPVDDRFAVYLALRELCAAAAADMPIVLVVDDLHWLDASSAEALSFLARRLGGARVALLVASRPGVPPWPGAQRLVLGGLDIDAAVALLGPQGLHDDAARGLAEALGCNPLALLEVASMLTAAQRSGVEPLGDPVPVGPTLERVYRSRADALPARTREALLLAATAGAGEDGGALADALAGRGLGPADLEPAEAAGLVVLAGPRVRFGHPLMRSAVFYGAAPADRRAAHAALAQVTGPGAARAWHLSAAVTGPDESAAAALEEAAADAEARGAVLAAVDAHLRAADLTHDGAVRRRRLAQTARTAIVAGRTAVARQALERVLADHPGDLERADAQLLLGNVALLDGDPMAAHSLLVAEAQRIEARDPLRAATLLTVAGVGLMAAGTCQDLIRTAEQAITLAAGTPGADLVPSVMRAAAMAAAGEHETAVAVLTEREDALLALARRPPGPVHEVVVVAGLGWMVLEDWPRAERILEGLIAEARTAGAVRGLAFPLAVAGALDIRRGRWRSAGLRLEEALTHVEDVASPFVGAFALCSAAYLDALCGREAACRDRCSRAAELETINGLTGTRSYRETALGTLALSAGRTSEARAHFERASAHLRDYGAHDPGFGPADGELVELHARHSSTADARAALAAFEGRVTRTQGRWASAVAARCRGLLEPDAANADAAFTLALRRHDELPMPFDRARTQLCWGERLRRHRRTGDAREQLTSAAAGFERLGATPWQVRAEAELEAAGVRRGLAAVRGGNGADSLTAQEQRVVDEVVRGASNREAAEAMFLSPRTVEHHLRQVFRKLGVRSRTELAATIAATRHDRGVNGEMRTEGKDHA